MVTNGYITEEALDVLAPHIDAYRVDVKGLTDDQYQELCRVRHVEPVLRAAPYAQSASTGCHVEIVTNVIPTFNDDDETLRGIAQWIFAELGSDPVARDGRSHAVSRVRTPSGEAPSPHSRSGRSGFGEDAGLRFVYLGNVPKPSRARTPSAPTASGSWCVAPAPRLKMSPCGEVYAPCAEQTLNVRVAIK